MIEYRRIQPNELSMELFEHFSRRQNVNGCYRMENGKCVVKPVAFIDDWSEDEYAALINELIITAKTGGAVFGAFQDGFVKGFASVESSFFGGENGYVDLSNLHVSENMRGHGIGKRLFAISAEWAKAHGAKKLYISAHSAVETQKFYRNGLGCTDAQEINAALAQKEPCDCQLEYIL